METMIITRSTAENEAPWRFVIEPSEVDEMMKELGLSSVMELLPTLVPAAKKMARTPISRFHVGAVGLGESGRIYLGVNLEFPGLPLHHSVHAEQFLITNAISHKERRIRCIAVSAAPCGHCRQFMQEIRNASEIEILITGSESGSEFRPLSSFLPEPFGPPDLLRDDVPLLLEPHDNHFEMIEMCDEIGGAARNVRLAAEKGAREAHAPYTGCPAGFAVVDREGRVAGGAYAESAAYNPGMGPTAAAMVAFVMAGGGDWEEIEEAALVEKEDALVSQEGTARLLLAAIAPKARLRVYHYRTSDADEL
ncbi:cytidine deaminase 1-like [Dioscorea cayenensis subsp. rotundata]|uniref:cytidine deaminase n=1 Tax=Dioscorea cayennensis subsp. rotundata TaxID=55577 RepID=A0AB40B3S8_DIOCR|nr:cytidine deaminase 1-like [Dioscorea cayenensis subsp. rotundata]